MTICLLLYETCTFIIENKIDVTKHFDFYKEKFIANARMRNPDIDIVFISEKTGEGIKKC